MSGPALQFTAIGTSWAFPVTTSAQAQLDQAARELESGYREFERATRDLNTLPAVATHERTALTQRKAEAWNSLEAARMRYEDVQERAARAGTGEV